MRLPRPANSFRPAERYWVPVCCHNRWDNDSPLLRPRSGEEEGETVSPDVEDIPDGDLVPDSADLQGREKLLESVKKIRQVLREEGLSKSQAHIKTQE